MSSPLERLANTESFRRNGDRATVTTTPFSAFVTVDSPSHDRLCYHLTIELPTIAAVTEEDISDVLLEGWATPLERRLADAGHATDRGDIDASMSWDREHFRVEYEIVQPVDAPPPAAALTSLVGYVEGTYLQGVIPGYTYREPVSSMLAEARNRGGRPG